MATSEPRWHPDAVQDAEKARDWYAARSPFAARGFLLSLEDAIGAVLEAPRRWPERRFGCRLFVFPNRYPFSLAYRVLSGNLVEIVAVAHAKRMPEYWRGR